MAVKGTLHTIEAAPLPSFYAPMLGKYKHKHKHFDCKFSRNALWYIYAHVLVSLPYRIGKKAKPCSALGDLTGEYWIIILKTHSPTRLHTHTLSGLLSAQTRIARIALQTHVTYTHAKICYVLMFCLRRGRERESERAQHSTQIGFVFLLVKHDQNQCKTEIQLSKFVFAANRMCS